MRRSARPPCTCWPRRRRPCAACRLRPRRQLCRASTLVRASLRAVIHKKHATSASVILLHPPLTKVTACAAAMKQYTKAPTALALLLTAEMVTPSCRQQHGGRSCGEAHQGVRGAGGAAGRQGRGAPGPRGRPGGAAERAAGAAAGAGGRPRRARCGSALTGYMKNFTGMPALRRCWRTSCSTGCACALLGCRTRCPAQQSGRCRASCPHCGRSWRLLMPRWL